jgi:hypothetical protein
MANRLFPRRRDATVGGPIGLWRDVVAVHGNLANVLETDHNTSRRSSSK